MSSTPTSRVSFNYYIMYCPYFRASVLVESTYSISAFKTLLAKYMLILKTNSALTTDEEKQFTVQKFVDRLDDDYNWITNISTESINDPNIDTRIVTTVPQL
jgi:hypothetical protein